MLITRSCNQNRPSLLMCTQIGRPSSTLSGHFLTVCTGTCACGARMLTCSCTYGTVRDFVHAYDSALFLPHLASSRLWMPLMIHVQRFA